MQPPEAVVVLVFFIILPSIFYGNEEADQVTFYVHNKCPFPIWPATAPNTDQPVIGNGGFYLASGKTKRIESPWAWSGRIWARTGCNFSSKAKPACETGDCDGRLACKGFKGTPPATLVEMTLASKGFPHSYDDSLVEGYNIPVSVTPWIINPKFTIKGCLKDLKSLCPNELEVLNTKGEVVGCKSAWLAFNIDRFCCRNECGIPEKCKPDLYSNIFKEACPNYYSYVYDTPPPLVSCESSKYIVTFCPHGWGGTVEHESK